MLKMHHLVFKSESSESHQCVSFQSLLFKSKKIDKVNHQDILSFKKLYFCINV